MNYCVSIGEREYRIKVSNDRLEVDGQNIDGDLIALNTGGLHMLRRGVRDLELHLREQDPGLFEVLIGAQRVMARVESSLRRSKRHGDTAKAGALSAPMPGLVTGVQVCEGEEVEKGQVLVLLESMKMQMQMRAPIAGRVSKVAVQRGAQVEKSTLLVQID
jgi:biotin carboxyl carrier protein